MSKLTIQQGFTLFAGLTMLLITLIVISLTIDMEDNIKILTSTTGCCSITIDNSDPALYSITYYNNLDNTSTVEVESTSADAEYTINTFQDYCLKNHPVQNWETKN